MELVTEEVRRLANRSADHASRIERKLRAIQNSSEEITGSEKGAVLLANTRVELSNEIRSTVEMLVRTYDALICYIEHSAETMS